jgi:hypothetical protein
MKSYVYFFMLVQHTSYGKRQLTRIEIIKTRQYYDVRNLLYRISGNGRRMPEKVNWRDHLKSTDKKSGSFFAIFAV